MVTGIPEIDNHIGASGPNSPAIIDHVVGRVYMLSKSQGGSRFVQQKLDEADPTYFAIFFDEMRPHMAELMMDSFAHYAVEKLIRNCTVSQRIELLQALSLDIITVACHKQGSFSIQSLMDTLQSDEEIAALGHSLDKDMVRLITNSSGHFVILRFLQHFPQSQVLSNLCFLPRSPSSLSLCHL
jgi:pumilio RNA-binding family